MDNKLGVSALKLNNIERKIVNIKLNLIDEYINFGRNKFDFEYLKQLNNFLFSDFYFEQELGTRYMSLKEKILVEELLIKIIENCLSNKDIEEILEIIEHLWHLQLFTVGNTRTLYAYLKVINSAFLLGLNIDCNKEIKSSPKIFELKNFVNQKRLTKIK